MDLTSKLEKAMRNAIHALPEFSTESEQVWCSALVDAADLISEGASMRLGELEIEDDDE